MVDSRRARENRAYVRRLLKKNQSGFAAVLASAEREFVCPVCGATDMPLTEKAASSRLASRGFRMMSPVSRLGEAWVARWRAGASACGR